MSGRATAEFRVGLVMEQVLGHVTHYHTLRRILAREPGIASRWVEVTYEGNSWLERLTCLPPSVRGVVHGFLQVREGLRGAPLDALFFHTHKPAVFQWDLLARVPTVLSLDVTPAQYDALGEFYDHAPDGNTAVARVKRWINRRTFALARRIVVWSNWVTNSLVADYGVPVEKIRVIPPGIDMDLWRSPANTRTATRWPRLLFVGGDFNRKGGPLLLEWFRQQGRGRCELDLMTHAAVAPEPGVRVHRNVVANSPEALQLFWNADVFVLPTLGECFGIATVEAMSAALPVITTRVGGAADIVQDRQTGLLIAPNDRRALASALDQLLANGSQRRAMGLEGRRRAERLFDAVANARALLACLEEAVPIRISGRA